MKMGDIRATTNVEENLLLVVSSSIEPFTEDNFYIKSIRTPLHASARRTNIGQDAFFKGHYSIMNLSKIVKQITKFHVY